MKLNLKKGDIVLGGKFRNKPYEFEKWDKDEHGQPVIVTSTGKKLKLLSVRIKKLMKEGKVICPICKKPAKENTEGNPKYCQGHSMFIAQTWKDLQKESIEQDLERYAATGEMTPAVKKHLEKLDQEDKKWAKKKCEKCGKSLATPGVCSGCRTAPKYCKCVKEGFNKPGGRQFGVSGERLKKVTCPQCKGTGNKSLTKFVACDKCQGRGFFKVDPAVRTELEGLGIRGLDIPANLSEIIKEVKVKEMSTVGSVGGYNAPLGAGYKTNKKGMKKNFRIKEEDRGWLESDMIDDWNNLQPFERDAILRAVGAVKDSSIEKCKVLKWNQLPNDYRNYIAKYYRDNQGFEKALYEMARPTKKVGDAIKKAIEMYDKNGLRSFKLDPKHQISSFYSSFDIIAQWIADETNEDVAYVKMFLKKPYRDLVALHNSQWALNPNSDRYKEMEETKSFKRIIKEIDLSLISGTLSNWVSQVSQTGELGKQFGANYKPADFEKWLCSEIEKNDLKISDKYVAKLMSRLKGHPKHDQFVVYNAFLSGAGLGLTERKKH